MTAVKPGRPPGASRERHTRSQMLPCARKSGTIVGTPVGWLRRMRVTQTAVKPLVVEDDDVAARSASRVIIDHLDGGNH